MGKKLKISMEAYKNRRQSVLNKMPDESVAILFGATELCRNADTHYPFRQNSDFYYLSGFNEPDALMILTKTQHSEAFILFCHPKSPEVEIWTGARVGIDNAERQYLADKAYPIEEIDQYLPSYLENKKNIFYTLGKNSIQDNRMINWSNTLKMKVRRGITIPDIWHDLSKLIHAQRLFKSDAEIDLMRKAASISANAHKKLMQHTQKMHSELELEGYFLQYSCQAGAKYQAYPCIVGSGKNACILHYTENSDTLEKDDLILVDAGCEYENYASDITRTFPRTGRFTNDQKLLYNIVLEAQTRAIAMVRPGLAWNEIQDTMVSIILKGLMDLNILLGDEKKLLEEKAYLRFYMHSSGHWLGLDVHDVGDYKVNGAWRKLEPGMVFTIEPGIYIPGNQVDIDKRWWDIGIRIEDDILVTAEGHEVLSAEAPKTIEEIEALMCR
jgi:Xaa-Pro aminopeptidase